VKIENLKSSLTVLWVSIGKPSKKREQNMEVSIPVLPKPGKCMEIEKKILQILNL
jgi:hypothetical protein